MSMAAPAAASSVPSWLRHILMAIGAGVVLNATSDYWMEKADACGIVAFVGKESAVDYLIEGLQILQSRGYDSAGVTTINSKGELVTTKYASKGSTSDSIAIVVKEAPERHKGDTAGISHTRWATHGGKTDQNAHPHLDHKNRVALVHNGTIENSAELKEELVKKGIPFRSETDTEVIVQLIGSYLDEKMPLVDAVKKAIGRLEGTWGLVILSKDHPEQLIAARHGSPLVIGVGKERMFVASEVSAFSRHVHEFVALKDGEVAVVTREGKGLDLSRVEQAHVEKIELSPHPYPHWTIKEIMEQPEAVARTLNYGGRFGSDGSVRLGGLDMNRDMLLGVRHLILGACGTSLYASMYGQLLFQKLKCFDSVQAVDASELFVDGFPAKEGGLLVVSQSGETKDVHRTLEIASSVGVPQFSVVNTVGSLIARTTRCGVYLNAGRENAVASTKAFTTQVTALALVAGWYSQNRFPGKSQDREELMDAIHRLPTYLGISLQTREKCSEIAKKLKPVKNMFILGKGYARPIAMEGALKIKEITYVHAEGYGGGALKHGPFALLDNQTPVVLIILDDQHAELMKIAAAQIKARGSYTIVITDKPALAKGIADDVITIPNNGPLTALLATIPLQLIAYEMSVSKGIDPDKPRHLAKAVTVD